MRWGIGSSGLICASAMALFLSAYLTGSATAGDDKLVLPVSAALGHPEASQLLDGSVEFYFGKTKYPSIKENLGEYITNKKTNSFARDELDACKWVMLSALVSLQERAKALGGDAVVNIRSYFKKNEASYDDKYECYEGFLMAGVALIGDIVKLKK